MDLGYVCDENLEPLLTNLGYTIEPGIYIDEEIGMRSEIDFYISNSLELIVTSPMQKTFVKL